MTTIPTITALPTPPSTDDPANFSTRADAFLGALQSPFVTEANAMAGAMNTVAGEVATNASAAATSASDAETASDAAQAAVGTAVAATTYVATSSTSLAVSAGAKAITLVESGRTFANNDDVTLVRRGDNRVRMRGVASSCNMGAKTMTVTVPAGGFSGSGTYTDWIVSHSAFTNLPGGKQSIPISVAAMIARTTNGPQMGLAEVGTNKIMRRSLDFDASTPEYAQFMMVMPKSWNEGTVSFAPIWAHGATTTNFKVSWGLRAVALSDGDALDAAATNLDPNPLTIGGTGWTTWGSPTITQNAATAPDGTMTAVRVQSTATNSGPWRGSISLATATTYTRSIWLKDNGGSVKTVRLGVGQAVFGGAGGDHNVTVNVADGTLSDIDPVYSATSVFVGENGWRRVSLTFTTTSASASAAFTIYGSESGVDFLVWDHELVEGAMGTAAMGTAQYSNDTGGATNTLYKGPESAAITIGGSPQQGDVVVFEIYRKADDGTNDTLAVDASLLGFVLYITTDAADDA